MKWFKKRYMLMLLLVSACLADVSVTGDAVDIGLMKFKEVFSEEYMELILLGDKKNIISLNDIKSTKNREFDLWIDEVISEKYLPDFDEKKVYYSKRNAENDYEMLKCQYMRDNIYLRIIQNSSSFYIIVKTNSNVSEKSVQELAEMIFNKGDDVIKYTFSVKPQINGGVTSMMVSNSNIDDSVFPWWANMSCWYFDDKVIFGTLKSRGDVPNFEFIKNWVDVR